MGYSFDKEWYKNLKKPKFQPPSWIFGPVWTVLYIFMFLALFLIIIENNLQTSNLKIICVTLFLLQLILNFSWTPVFFVRKNLKGAFLLCIFLAFAVALTTFTFFYAFAISGLLMLPYLIWSIFATYLSGAIWLLNRDRPPLS